jgi:HD-GYP domain-containing protein (c-di-GMP phosphodiesterase class II)
MVARFAVEIAKISAKEGSFNDFENVLETLRFAGLLHDISK